MKSFRAVFVNIMAVLLITGVYQQVYAERHDRGLTYSPDHWPNRWSSAIRQQQNGGRFPTREKQKFSRHKEQESVSDKDLFSSSSQKRHFDRDGFFAERLSRHRQLRDASRHSRDAAFAYHDMANAAYPYPEHSPYAGYPLGTAPLGIDPVLGHPGIGIPLIPGVPYGYPLGVYPYGAYPGLGIGAWNPPFGAW